MMIQAESKCILECCKPLMMLLKLISTLDNITFPTLLFVQSAWPIYDQLNHFHTNQIYMNYTHPFHIPIWVYSQVNQSFRQKNYGTYSHEMVRNIRSNEETRPDQAL